MRPTVSVGKRASRSIASAIGRTSLSAKPRARAGIMVWSGVRSSCTLLVQEVFELLGEEGGDLEEVTDDAVVGDLEDRRLRVLVDRADHLGGPHAGQVLDRAGDAEAQVELGRDRAPGLADLEPVRPPARVHRRARGPDRRANHLGQLFQYAKVPRPPERARPRYHHLRP